MAQGGGSCNTAGEVLAEVSLAAVLEAENADGLLDLTRKQGLLF